MSSFPYFPRPLPPSLAQCLEGLGHVIYVPNPGNLGDELIAASTIMLFERLGVSYEIYREGKDYGQGYTLVYGGGGIMVPECGARAWLLGLLTAPGLARCVVLPHSLRHCDDLLKVMDERFTVFCREKESLAYALAGNRRARFELADDMAFYTAPCLLEERASLLDRMPFPGWWARALERCGCSKGRSMQLCRFYRKTLARLDRHLGSRLLLAENGQRVALFLRRDREAHASLRLHLEGLPTLDLSRYGGGDCRWHEFNLLGAAQMAHAIEVVDIVVTDRLHVSIMAAMQGKHCIMIDNTYGKLSGVWEQSMQDMPQITLCRTEAELRHQLNRLGKLRLLNKSASNYDGVRSPWRKRWHALWKLKRSRQEVIRINGLYPQRLVKEADEIMQELRQVVCERAALPFQDIVPEYFAMGLNYRGKRLENYIFWNEWKRQREKLDSRAGHEARILRHKLRQLSLFRRAGVHVPAYLGILVEQEGHVFLLTKEHDYLPLESELQRYGSLFAKPLGRYGGHGCLKLDESKERQGCLVNGKPTHWRELAAYVADSPLLMVEEKLEQHERLSALNPTSINTLRLWTTRNRDGSLSYLQGIIRLGTGGSCMDNACQGGICVPLAPDGTLGHTGWQPYRLPMLPVTEHPDTGVHFAGYVLPMFDACVALALRAHACFSRRVGMVAWDIAVTPSSPVLVEANLRGGTTIMQACHGGWRFMARERLLPLVQWSDEHAR